MHFNPSKGLIGAFALGFFFSFGWTPCVGPVLGAVLGLASQQGGALTGGGLLLIYAFGLSLPFAVLALSSKHLLGRIKSIYPHFHKIKIAGGILIILMGCWMIWGQIISPGVGQNAFVSNAETHPARMQALNAAPANLDDFKGKVVCIKFWATWCPLCLAGLEDFTALSAQYNGSEDVAIISVVTPGLNREIDKDDFTTWVKTQGLSFPIYLDEYGTLIKKYGIRAYPNYVYLGKDGGLLAQKVGDASNADIIKELVRFGIQER